MHPGLVKAINKLSTLPPQTRAEVVPGLTLKVKANGIPVMRLHYSADPDRDPATEKGRRWYDATRAKYDSDKAGWDREYEIVDEAGGGERIFSDVLTKHKDLIIITDPRWKPNPAWGVVGGFDHGGTNPTVLEKAYIDNDGNLYFAGEYYSYKRKDFDSTISSNAPEILQMPDLDRARWVNADPSIFWDTVPTEEGALTAHNSIYKTHGVDMLRSFDGERNDLTFVARLLEDRWAKLLERKPRLYIVCRNESDKRQPGLHPYDSPNLLWELKRIRRAQLTSKQLMTRNPTEQIVDKDNHAFDAMKYVVMQFPKAEKEPLGEQLKKVVEGLNPMSAQIAAVRFMNMHSTGSKGQVSMKNKGKQRR